MTELFYAVLKASFQGSIVILAVLLLRLVLKRAPRSVFCLLWLLAGLRLALPFEIESKLSLQPQLQEPQLSIQMEAPVQVPDFVVPEVEADVPEAPSAPVDPGNYENIQHESFLYYENDGVVSPITFGDIAAWVWLLGMGIMVLASLWSYLKLKRRVRMAYLIENGCFECPGLDTAFVLGFLPPKIYLPAGLRSGEKKFIFDHENTHIARGDHWYKLLGYLVLSLHWFNPLVWVGYSLLCRDIELACDEHVVKFMSLNERKAYSAALLNCGGHTARIAACPVAFGESNPKKRILNVLNYKRPTFWISLIAVIAVVFVAVCLLTSPNSEQPQEEGQWNLEMEVADVTPSGAQVRFIQSGLFKGSDRANLQYGSHYTLDKWVDGQWEAVEMLPQEYDVAWTMEAYLIKLNSTNAFNLNWEWLYGKLPAGRYRIGKGVTLDYIIGETEHQTFYAEFEITEEASQQTSGEERAYIAHCREAMLTLKTSEELYLYISNLDDPMATTNVYMHASNGWLFKYRRPGWDCEEVQWLRLGNAQYIYGGDMDDNGVMTTPYYWQVEQNPDSHDYQLPYPFDLDWENIELTYSGTVTESGYEYVTILFPLHLDKFTFCFNGEGELAYFDVGDSTGEPEATTSRYYVLTLYDVTVADYLTGLYEEVSAKVGQKPGTPDDAFYEELFTRIADGAYAEMWISDLFRAFYADPGGFASHLAGRDRAQEIITFMGYNVNYYAPYRFAQTLQNLGQEGIHDREIIDLLKSIGSGEQAAQQEQTDDLTDAIAWLAQCATALDNYQNQGSWVVLVENTFTGDGAMNPYSTALWYIDGQDWHKQAITGSADFTAEHGYLKKAGKTYCRESATIHDPANGDGFSTAWTEDSQYADMPLPWPLTFNWADARPEYVQADHWDRGEKVTFAVQGSPYAGDQRGIDSYQVTFWLTEKGELWSIQIAYTQKDTMGETTNVQSVITPNAAAPEEAEKMIELKYQEALSHCAGTVCNDPACTDAFHDHSNVICTDTQCTNSTHHHDDHH